MSQLVWDEGPNPVGAACVNDDVVIVVDGSAVVRAYDADGGILAAVELHATADGEPHKGRPPQWTGVIFCGNDDSVALLSDAANARVCVMHCPDPTLAEPMVLLAEASAAGADGRPGIGLRSPRGLAVDSTSGAIVVADAGRQSCLVLLPTVPQLAEALQMGATTEGGAHVAAAVHAEAVHSGTGAMTVVAELVGLDDPSSVALVRVKAADPAHAPLLIAAVADTGAHSIAVFVMGDRLLRPGREPVRMGEAWRVGRPGRGDGEMVHPLGVAVWQPGAFSSDQQPTGAKARLREPCRAEDAVLVACDAGNARLQAWPLCGPASAVLWIIERAGDTEAEAMVRPAAVCLSSEGEALVVDVGKGAWIMLPDDEAQLEAARHGTGTGASADPHGDGGAEVLAGVSSDEEDREAEEMARGRVGLDWSRGHRLELHPPGWGPDAARRRLHRRAKQRPGDQQAGLSGQQAGTAADWDAAAAAKDQADAEAERRRRELSGGPDDTDSRDTGLELLRHMKQAELDTAAKRRALAAAIAANEAAVASLAVFAPALALAGARPRDTPPDAQRLCGASGEAAPAGAPKRSSAPASPGLPPVPKWLAVSDVPPVPDYGECRSEAALRARLVDLKAACKLVARDVSAWEAAGQGPSAEAKRLAELVDAVRARASTAAVPSNEPLTVDQALEMVRQAEARNEEAQAELREAEEAAVAEEAAWSSERRRLRAELADQRERSERARKAGAALGTETAMAERRLELLRQEQAELRQRDATRLAALSADR